MYTLKLKDYLIFINGVVLHSVSHCWLIDVWKEQGKTDLAYIIQQWAFLWLHVTSGTKRHTQKLGPHILR